MWLIARCIRVTNPRQLYQRPADIASIPAEFRISHLSGLCAGQSPFVMSGLTRTQTYAFSHMRLDPTMLRSGQTHQDAESGLCSCRVSILNGIIASSPGLSKVFGFLLEEGRRLVTCCAFQNHLYIHCPNVVLLPGYLRGACCKTCRSPTLHEE